MSSTSTVPAKDMGVTRQSREVEVAFYHVRKSLPSRPNKTQGSFFSVTDTASDRATLQPQIVIWRCGVS